MRNIIKIATAATCSFSTIIGIVFIDFQDEIRTSQAGLEIIGNAESCLNEPYYCSTNILTVGVGSTTGAVENGCYSNEEIATCWVSDRKEAEQCVNQSAMDVQLAQSVFDVQAKEMTIDILS